MESISEFHSQHWHTSVFHICSYCTCWKHALQAYTVAVCHITFVCLLVLHSFECPLSSSSSSSIKFQENGSKIFNSNVEVSSLKSRYSSPKDWRVWWWTLRICEVSNLLTGGLVVFWFENGFVSQLLNYLNSCKSSISQPGQLNRQSLN